jgi:hypothetical protein
MNACADANASGGNLSLSSERDLLTHQTGQLLTTLGHMFVNLPAFNSHIDQNTGELLISLGKKLKGSAR